MFSLKKHLLLLYIIFSSITSIVKADDCSIFRNSMKFMGSARDKYDARYDASASCCEFDCIQCDNEQHITEM